jgi:hypothetical protein
MPERPLTVGDVEHHAATLSAMAAALLTGLASGKYDKHVAFAENLLAELGLAFPPAAMVEKGVEVFLLINKMTAGRGHVVADGRGGFVTQSWADDPRHKLNPDGSFQLCQSQRADALSAAAAAIEAPREMLEQKTTVAIAEAGLPGKEADKKAQELVMAQKAISELGVRQVGTKT